jgi:hypothetical protein
VTDTRKWVDWVSLRPDEGSEALQKGVAEGDEVLVSSERASSYRQTLGAEYQHARGAVVFKVIVANPEYLLGRKPGARVLSKITWNKVRAFRKPLTLST